MVLVLIDADCCLIFFNMLAEKEKGQMIRHYTDF